MTNRLKTILREIPSCEIFADIGCDHGYIAKAMLELGKAKKVIIADISEKCLKKAEELLVEEIKSGRAKSVVSNGFEKIEHCSVALIAGMGGEEIIQIIKKENSLPEILVLQPMKNCDKVRRCVVNKGYRIEKDFVFKASNKFYELIVLVKGKDFLTEEEMEFGRSNLLQKNPDFIEMINSRIEKYREYAEQIPDGQKKNELNKRIEKLERYV